jgi:lysozyme
MITNLKDQLIRDEGVILHPYIDSVGKTTIGVGRNLVDNGITIEEAMSLLVVDLARAKLAVCEALPWAVSLSEPRKAVLVNMAFNLGIHGLLGFVLTLGLVKDGRYVEASDEMLNSKWATQVGIRATRLSRQMATDIWQ